MFGRRKSSVGSVFGKAVAPKTAAEMAPPAMLSKTASKLLNGNGPLFSSDDTELTHYLTAGRPTGSYADLKTLSDEQRFPGRQLLLDRAPTERAHLFVVLAKMLSAYDVTRKKNHSDVTHLKDIHGRATHLVDQLLAADGAQYSLEDVAVLATQSESIARYNLKCLRDLAARVLDEHIQSPSSTTRSLVQNLCLERGENHVRFPRLYAFDPAFLSIVERAHAAMGGREGTHPLSIDLRNERDKYRAEIERLIGLNAPSIEVFVNSTLAGLKTSGQPEADRHASDCKLLIEDFQSKDAVEKGQICFDAWHLAEEIAASPLYAEKPQFDARILNEPTFFKHLERSLREVCQALVNKKVVFKPEHAIAFLTAAAGRKGIEFSQGYKALPAQFWPSLGNSLPKQSSEVRHLILSAKRLGEKRINALLAATGMAVEQTDDQVIADCQAELDKVRAKIETAIAREQSGGISTSNDPGGVLNRIFGSVAKNEKVSRCRLWTCAPITTLKPVGRLLIEASYLNLDTSREREIMRTFEESARNEVAALMGEQARQLSVADLQALSQKHYYDTNESYALNAAVRYAQMCNYTRAFDNFTVQEREQIANITAQLHPLPDSSKPSQKWLDRLDGIQADDIVDKVLVTISSEVEAEDPFIQAFALAASRVPGTTVQALKNAVNYGFEDAPNGKRHEKLGNAALWSLSLRRSNDAIETMREIAETCRFITGRNAALKYFGEMVGGDIDDPLLAGETKLPPLRLWPDAYRENLNEGFAQLVFYAPDSVSVLWQTSDGKTSTQTPSSMKSADPTGVKRVKKLIPQMSKSLLQHITWIENMYLAQSELSFDAWSERYLNHETRAVLTRALIWQAKTANGDIVSFIPVEDGFATSDSKPLDPSAATISLWHPAHEGEAVQQWRSYILDNMIAQPFAQAFRAIDGAQDFDAQVEKIEDVLIDTGRFYGTLTPQKNAEFAGWVGLKKTASAPAKHEVQDTKIHYFNPVSRLYIEGTFKLVSRSERVGHSNWWGYGLSDFTVWLADLGAEPTKAGLKKKKPLDPAELSAVQRAELIRRIHAIVGLLLGGSVKNGVRLQEDETTLPKEPVKVAINNERPTVLVAYAAKLADPSASKKWRGSDQGEIRISTRADGRIHVNGIERSYIYCPYEDYAYDAETMDSMSLQLRDGFVDNASNIPFGSDPHLRKMVAKIQLMTKDDRTGNCAIKQQKTRYR